jgi:beta-mannanase
MLLVAPMTSFAATTQPFGLYQPSNNLSYSIGSSSQYKYAIQYYGWSEDPQSADISALPTSVTPFLEMQTCGNPCNTSNSISLTSITSGTYDTYLSTFASDIATLNRPVLLTFDHEQNGSWYPWNWYSGNAAFTSQAQQESEWIAAWNHVTSKIDSNAAAKKLVTWVWAPNIEQGGSAVSLYWSNSGTTVQNVGAVGLDGYYANSGTTWANRIATSYTDVMSASGGKLPFYLSETGIPPGDSNAVSQIDNLVSGAASVNAAGVMYFDAGSYVMTSAMQTEFLNDVN